MPPLGLTILALMLGALLCIRAQRQHKKKIEEKERHAEELLIELIRAGDEYFNQMEKALKLQSIAKLTLSKEIIDGAYCITLTEEVGDQKVIREEMVFYLIGEELWLESTQGRYTRGKTLVNLSNVRIEALRNTSLVMNSVDAHVASHLMRS